MFIIIKNHTLINRRACSGAVIVLIAYLFTKQHSHEINIVYRRRYPGHRLGYRNFAYSAGGLIHVLLVIAIISLILGILRKDTTVV
jgi:hypothetical protein